jgi:hypothetical protein
MRVAPGTAALANTNLKAAPDITVAGTCEVIVQCAFDQPTGVYLSTSGGAQLIPLADPIDGTALQQNKLYTLRFLATPTDAFNLQLAAPCNILSFLVNELTGDVY